MPISLFILLMVTSSAAIIWNAVTGYRAAKVLGLNLFKDLIIITFPLALVGINACGVFKGSVDSNGGDMEFYANLWAIVGLVSGFVLIASVTYVKVMFDKTNKLNDSKNATSKV